MKNEKVSQSEYLVISRGQWDRELSPEEIQKAIDQFYVWLARLVDEGKMKTGQRLGSEGKTVSRKNIVTDGPFGEAKEVIGGLLVYHRRQSRRSSPNCRRKPLSKLRLVFRDSTD
jgi:hypothetical protein